MITRMFDTFLGILEPRYSRITNWHTMSEADQKKTMAMVAKRNKKRVAKLAKGS